MAQIRRERYLDWPTVLLYAALVGLGWLNVYAAVYNPDNVKPIWDVSLNSGKQLWWIATAFIIIVLLLVVDYKVYEGLAYQAYILMLIVLVITLFVAPNIKGSRSWLEVGAFRLQPAEFAKFVTALAVAKFLSQTKLHQQTWQDHAKLVVLTVLPPLIIKLQDETGQALVFAALLLPYYREGMSPLPLVLGVAAGGVFVLTMLVPPWWLVGTFTLILAVYFFLNQRMLRRWLAPVGIWLAALVEVFSIDFFINNVLKDYQRKRILVLFDQSLDPRGMGYNLNQSKIAIGSGGLIGKGFLQGTQTKFDFVPEQSTDFIFCTVGEEWGWLGALVLVSLFMALLLRIVYIAERQKSVFGRTYGYCVAAIIFFHFMVNIGMTIGLAPVIGIPLPFFSYGGSGLWSFTILLFILLAIDANRKQDLTR
jgi:rod shape determining protein RodA